MKNSSPKSDQLLNVLKIIGGKWKLIIIRELIGRTMRFGELKRSIGSITHKVLADNLQALEENGIIKRVVYNESTLRVEYSLTPAGYKFTTLHRYIISCYYDYLNALTENNNDVGEYEDEFSATQFFYESNSSSRNENNKDNEYITKINKVKYLIDNSDHIIIGTGSGINNDNSQIDHFSKKEAQTLFPKYFGLGLQNIDEMIDAFSNISKDNEIEYWDFWAKYIHKIRFKRKASQAHRLLASLFKDRNYFIISTNSDGLLEEVSFSKNRIFLPLGDYNYLQCMFPCNKVLYESKQYIEIIQNHLSRGNPITEKLIPKCPNCGSYLVPNHYRMKTISLVESNNLARHSDFCEYLNQIRNDNNLLIEIGCGMRLPHIIRHRFENFLLGSPSTYLIRINRRYPDLQSKKVTERFFSFKEDISQIFEDLLS